MENTELLKSPFFTTMRIGQGEIVTGTVSSSDRCAMVKRFNREQCLAALEHTDGLQATVEKQLRTRLQKLESEQ